MAIMKILAVRDRCIDGFFTPMHVVALGAGIRAFIDEVNRADQNNPLYRHPDDHDLYHIGDYDDSTGVLIPCSIRMLLTGKEAVKPSSKE